MGYEYQEFVRINNRIMELAREGLKNITYNRILTDIRLEPNDENCNYLGINKMGIGYYYLWRSIPSNIQQIQDISTLRFVKKDALLKWIPEKKREIVSIVYDSILRVSWDDPKKTIFVKAKRDGYFLEQINFESGLIRSQFLSPLLETRNRFSKVLTTTYSNVKEAEASLELTISDLDKQFERYCKDLESITKKNQQEYEKLTEQLSPFVIINRF